MKIKKIKNGVSDAKRRNANVVCFEFNCGNARSVGIAGTFNDWNPKATTMFLAGTGRWMKELTLPPGHYEYQYVVDGKWINDPRAVKSTPNPYGGRNSVLVVERKERQ